MKQRTLLVMAGGTGGHVFPGLAVADRLRQQGWTIHWLGTRERMEAELVPQHGYPIHFIEVKALRGKGIKQLLCAPWILLRALLQAKRHIQRLQPDVVLGMGGFASGPGGIAAKLCSTPLILHEQNAAAGLTNRILALVANRVLEAFSGTFKHSSKVKVVGNPVREALCHLPLPEQRIDTQRNSLRILVLGGSQGARALNQTLPKAFGNIEAPLEIMHQCGKNQRDPVLTCYQHDAQQIHQLEITDFITDMAQAYAWADLVICRAGALTVAEVAAVGVGALFIPFSHAVDDHQTKNAQFLVNSGAALLLPEQELTTERLVAMVNPLAQDRDRLIQMGMAARAAAIFDATDRVAAECEQLAGKEIIS